MIKKKVVQPLKLYKDKPVVLYAVRSDRPINKLPHGAIHIWSIPKVGSMSLFNSLMDSCIECAKFHHGADWNSMRPKSTHKIIDCVREPLATTFSLMFQYLCIGREHVGDFHFCNEDLLKQRYTENKLKLFKDLFRHFQLFIKPDNIHICKIMNSHIDDLSKYTGIMTGHLNELKCRKFKQIRSKDADNMIINYLIFKFEYINDPDIMTTLKTFIGYESFTYTSGHKTDDKNVIGLLYKEFKEFVRNNFFSRKFIEDFYNRTYVSIFYNNSEIEQFKTSWISDKEYAAEIIHKERIIHEIEQKRLYELEQKQKSNVVEKIDTHILEHIFTQNIVENEASTSVDANASNETPDDENVISFIKELELKRHPPASNGLNEDEKAIRFDRKEQLVFSVEQQKLPDTYIIPYDVSSSIVSNQFKQTTDSSESNKNRENLTGNLQQKEQKEQKEQKKEEQSGEQKEWIAVHKKKKNKNK